MIASIRWFHTNHIWECYGYTIMPDHLHVVFKLGDSKSLSEAMQSFGNYTALRINQHDGRSGKLWQKAFYDRQVRDDEELSNQLEYISQNPVRKGYVEDQIDWPFCEIYPNWQ